MNDFSKTVKEILNDPKKILLANLTIKIVKKIVQANAAEIVLKKDAEIEIAADCEEFKKELAKYGLEAPDDNLELYHLVIKEVFLQGAQRSV